MKKSRLLLVALFITAMLPLSLGAQEKEVEVEKYEVSCKGGLHAMKALDPEVKLQLEKLRVELRLANVDLMKKKAELHDKMMEEFSKDDPSRKAIDKLSSQILDVSAKMMSNRHDHMLKARKIAGAEHIIKFMGCMGGHGDCDCGMGHKSGCGAGRMTGHRGCGDRMKGAKAMGRRGGCGSGDGRHMMKKGAGCGIGGDHECAEKCAEIIEKKIEKK